MRTGDMFRMLPFGNANMAFHCWGARRHVDDSTERFTFWGFLSRSPPGLSGLSRSESQLTSYQTQDHSCHSSLYSPSVHKKGPVANWQPGRSSLANGE